MVKQVTDSECGVDGDELTCRRRVCRETEDGIRWAWGKAGTGVVSVEPRGQQGAAQTPCVSRRRV
jgi:hypothetical protein